jgi:hypothetical protein
MISEATRPAARCEPDLGGYGRVPGCETYAAHPLRAALADGAEAGRCQQEIGPGQRGGSTRVRSTPQRVAGVQAKLVQDASNERVEGLEPVAIRTAGKRQRVRPRKSLKDERILRDVGLALKQSAGSLPSATPRAK